HRQECKRREQGTRHSGPPAGDREQGKPEPLALSSWPLAKPTPKQQTTKDTKEQNEKRRQPATAGLPRHAGTGRQATGTAKSKSLEPQRAQRSQRKIYENRKRWAGKRITSGSIMQRAECIFGQKNFVMFAAIPLEPASLLAKSLYGSSSG